MRLAIFCLLASAVFPSPSRAQEAPVFKITLVESVIRFYVKASMNIAGRFDEWDDNLAFYVS